MIHLHTKFQVPQSNGVLAINVKSKAKYALHEATILLFYITQKRISIKATYSKCSCLLFHKDSSRP